MKKQTTDESALRAKVKPVSESPIIKAMTDSDCLNHSRWLKPPTNQAQGFHHDRGNSNCNLPKIPLPHKGCRKTHEAGGRGYESCLRTEFARWLHPCKRGFSTSNADVRVETSLLSLHHVTVCDLENKRYCNRPNQSI